MKKVTIRDVAREAGVSVTLVSFVMNAKMGKNGRLDCPVNPNTATRVLEVAKRLGYRRNNAAASLRSGRSRTIAVIVSDISMPFFADICRIIESIAYKEGYTVIFASSEENPQKLAHLVDTLVGFNVEGLILAPCLGSEDAVSRIKSVGIPTVLIDRDFPGDDFGRVLVDNVDSGKVAANYLIHQGFGKIEMITYNNAPTSITEREAGYAEAMEEAGLKDDIKIHKIDHEPSVAKKSVVEIFRDAKTRGTEAFILPTERLAMFGFYSLIVLGMLTPRDVALVCLDQNAVYKLNKPSIPHVIQPLNDIAEKSFSLLQRMIEGDVSEEDKSIILKAELVLGSPWGTGVIEARC